MKRNALLIVTLVLSACGGTAELRQGHSEHHDGNAGQAAVEACKSALALRSGFNTVYVLPISHGPFGTGQQVFLSLHQEQWLCTTDSRGNVNRLEKR